MTAIRTYGQNAFQTQLSAQMGPNDLLALVQSIGGLTSPCYLVIDYNDDNKREIILFDGTFSSGQFATTSIGNRYLAGSAQGSNITHDVGATVISAPVYQNIEDLHDRMDSGFDHGSMTGLGDDDHPQYLPKSGGTLTGALTLDGDPTSDLHAATKQYVDGVASGVVMNSVSATLPGVDLSTNTVFGEVQISIPSDWNTFYIESYGFIELDPIGYAYGTIYAEYTRSDDVNLRQCASYAYDHPHSEPVVLPYAAHESVITPVNIGDLLGDRVIKLRVRGTYSAGGGTPDAAFSGVIKATRAS